MKNLPILAISLVGTAMIGTQVAADEDKSSDTVDGVYSLTCGSSIKDEYRVYMSVILDLRHASHCELKNGDDLAVGRHETIEELGVSCKLRPASRLLSDTYEEWTAKGLPISKTYHRLVDSCGFTTVSTFFGLEKDAAHEICGTLKTHLDQFTGNTAPVSECVEPVSQEIQ